MKYLLIQALLLAFFVALTVATAPTKHAPEYKDKPSAKSVHPTLPLVHPQNKADDKPAHSPKVQDHNHAAHTKDGKPAVSPAGKPRPHSGINNGKEAHQLLDAIEETFHDKVNEVFQQLLKVVKSVKDHLCKQPANKLIKAEEAAGKQECQHCKPSVPHEQFVKELLDAMDNNAKMHHDNAEAKKLAKNKDFQLFALCSSNLTWNVQEKGGKAVQNAEHEAHLAPSITNLNHLKHNWFQDKSQCVVALQGILALSTHIDNKSAHIKGHSPHKDHLNVHKIEVVKGPLEQVDEKAHPKQQKEESGTVPTHKLEEDLGFHPRSTQINYQIPNAQTLEHHTLDMAPGHPINQHSVFLEEEHIGQSVFPHQETFEERNKETGMLSHQTSMDAVNLPFKAESPEDITFNNSDIQSKNTENFEPHDKFPAGQVSNTGDTFLDHQEQHQELTGQSEKPADRAEILREVANKLNHQANAIEEKKNLGTEEVHGVHEEKPLSSESKYDINSIKDNAELLGISH